MLFQLLEQQVHVSADLGTSLSVDCFITSAEIINVLKLIEEPTRELCHAMKMYPPCPLKYLS
ncbi:hypothetical protein PR048_032996 [Dryococelus australis]|uniref:Uncharacterized protein n=1 Tax=Dryococelus australis TaxID=614101 RepID=A0ABQ9G6R2_9NEOP|nr:hypothetical protein PR048_032996 [Dryococelus australis]